MGNIPQFQRNFVSQQTQFQSPAAAAAPFEAAAGFANSIADIQVQKMEKMKQADDFTAVNEVGLRTEAELNDEMQAFQQANSGNPDKQYAKFDEVVSAKLQAQRDQLPSEEAKMMFDKYGAQLRGSYQSKMQGWEDETKAFNFASRVEAAAETNNKMAMMDGNLANLDKYIAQAQATTLAGSTIVSPEKLDVVRKKNIGGAVKSLLMGAAEKNPAAARAALKDERFNKYIDSDDMVSLDNHFEALGKKMESDARASESRSQLTALNELKGRMAQGVDVSNDAQELYKAGKIDGSQFLSVVKSQKSFTSKEAEKAAGREKIALIGSGDAVLDPTNKKDMAALDDYYSETFTPTIQDLPADEQARSISDFVGQYGAVPPSLKSQINGSLMAGNPDQQAKAASMVSTLVVDNPRVAGQLDSKMLGQAMRLNDLANAGVPLEQAVKSAQDSVYLAGTPEYAERAKQYNDIAGGKNPQIAIDPDDFNQTFRNDPSEIPPEMKRQWDALAKMYYIDQGLNSDSAIKLANSKIQQTWSITNVGRGGKEQWMQYAPEAYYGNVDTGNTSWIKKQLISDLAATGAFKNSEVGKVSDDRGKFRNETEKFMESAYLVPVPNSLTSSGKPSYYVYREEEGIHNIVLGTNPKTGQQEAVVFQPDFNETPRGKRLVQKSEEARARAADKSAKAYAKYIENEAKRKQQIFQPDEVPTGGISAFDNQLGNMQGT